jgi:hypothetical protein
MRTLLSLALLAALASACTPLLGGDIACNDDGDCPPERRNCRAQLCRDESIPDPSEGEGEGEQPSLTVSLAITSPQPNVPDEEVVFTFDAPGAEACTLDFDLIPRNPRTLTRDEMDARSFGVTLSIDEATALVEASGGLQAAIARLRCTRGADQAEALQLVVWDVVLRVGLTASTTVLPAEGGEVELCWTAPAGSTCDLTSYDNGLTWLGVQGGAPTGCVTANVDDNGTPYETRGFQLACSRDGLWGYGGVSVVRGQGIARFEPSSTLLLEPGVVTFTWEAYAERCALGIVAPDGALPIEALAEGLEVAHDVVVNEDTDFVLQCFDDAGAELGSPRVTVRVGPRLEDFDAVSINRGDYVWAYGSRFMRSCSAVLSSGERSGGLAVAPRFTSATRLLFAPAEDAPVTLTVSCEGFAGELSESKTFAALRPPRIVDAHFRFTEEPVGLHTVGLCWRVEDADSCWIFADDDAEPAPLSGCVDHETDSGVYRQLYCTNADGSVWDDHWFELGEAIRSGSLSAWPRALAAPGEVAFSWTSQATTGCALVDEHGVERAAGLEGDVTLFVDETTSFDLICQDPDIGPSIERATIVVGPAITELQTRVSSFTDLSLSWTAENVPRCELSVDNLVDSIVLDHLAPRTSAGYSHRLVPRAQWKGSTFGLPISLEAAGDTTITLSCDTGDGGLIEETRVVAEPAAADITSFQSAPAALPEGGGEVDLCWSASGALSCSMTVVVDDLATAWFELPADGCLSTDAEPLALTETARVDLACWGVLGGENASIVIPVGPFIGALAASPAHLIEPGTVIVSWEAANVEECRLLDGDGIEVASGGATDSAAIALEAGERFTLSCDEGVVQRALFVAVGSTIITLEAEALDANAIAWSFEGALVESCDLRFRGEDGWGELLELTDCENGCASSLYWTFSQHGATTVRARCTDSDGELLESSVVVEPPTDGPQLTLDASLESFPAGGGETELCWTATNATTCWLDGVGVATSGCETRLVDADTYVTFSCLDDGSFEPTSVSRRIAVGPAITRFEFDPRVVFADEETSATLHWDTQYLTSCVLSGEWIEATAVAPSGTLVVELPEVADGFYPHPFFLDCSDEDGPPEGAVADASGYAELMTAR